ncbi:pyridoxal phosphate-dependent aminotransferase [Pendulispora albinea]|uniref:Pyridoxal phosphate-dependent aminotransferase n=1 Tax=Pendulispora albinea TaxID=2741071 RepID=A0ABZ2LUT8_9BACT
MFPRVQYLEWAVQHLGRKPFDLAISGMTVFPLSELGPPPDLDDTRAWPLLRAAIARYNARPPGEAVPSLGTAHALWLAHATLLTPGDEILVESPAYETLLAIAAGVGARVIRFSRPEGRDYALDPDVVAAKLTDRTRLVVITNLHNPTGTRASDDALREVARLIGLRGGHLLVDEVYAPFDDFADKDGVWSGSARHLADNIVTAASLTKCYGLGPHRFGWLLGPADVIARAETTLLASVGALPVSHAQLFIHALGHVQELAARSKRLLADKRARTSAWLAEKQPRFAWSGPQSGLFGLASLPGAGDLRPALERGADEHGALVVPGSFFEVPNGFRLSWSLDDPRLDEALDRLGRILRAL